jgi:hypothetical protein
VLRFPASSYIGAGRCSCPPHNGSTRLGDVRGNRPTCLALERSAQRKNLIARRILSWPGCRERDASPQSRSKSRARIHCPTMFPSEPSAQLGSLSNGECQPDFTSCAKSIAAINARCLSMSRLFAAWTGRCVDQDDPLAQNRFQKSSPQPPPQSEKNDDHQALAKTTANRVEAVPHGMNVMSHQRHILREQLTIASLS